MPHLFLALAVLAMPQATLPANLSKSIQEAKLSPQDEGNFVYFNYSITETKRKQKIYLRRVVEDYRSLKEHEVFGIVWESATAATEEQLLDWAQRRFGVGGLIYERPSETQPKFRLRFSLTVPSNVSPKELADLLNVAAATSDDIEAKVNPGLGDQF